MRVSAGGKQVRGSEDWNSLKYDQCSKYKLWPKLEFYEHFIAYAGLLNKRRALILFLRSQACTAKVFIGVKYVHHN